MTLTEIETQFNFRYSQLYKTLEHDGMLNVGDYGPNWYSSVFPQLKDNPTLFLHSNNLELLNINSIPKEINNFAAPDDYRQIDPTYKFIPFAQTGAGDHYCFFLNEQDGDEIPVVLVWHDSDRADYLAKNLQNYIFRVLLLDMAEQDTYNNVSDEEFRDNIERVLKTHTKYLTEQQAEIIQNIFAREISDYAIVLPGGRNETQRGLLTEIEVQEILSAVAPFDKMQQSFVYTLPEKIEEITEDNIRRVGTLTIKIQPVPPRHDKIYTVLKDLNWRQKKPEQAHFIEYFRKQSVIFGRPSMTTVDLTFRSKLLELKSISENIEIQFQEEATQIVYPL